MGKKPSDPEKKDFGMERVLEDRTIKVSPPKEETPVKQVKKPVPTPDPNTGSIIVDPRTLKIEKKQWTLVRIEDSTVEFFRKQGAPHSVSHGIIINDILRKYIESQK